MSRRTLAIVTTRLPPAMCGIGAYSALLRRHWPGDFAAEFLVVDDAAEAQVLAGDKVIAFNGNGARLARELDRIGAGDVLLHYAGRAYQRFGCPRWMPGVFQNWKAKFPGGRLMIVVHEMPADGFPITSRHFWLGKMSVGILRRLAAQADVLVTNTEHHLTQLRRIRGRDDVHLLPVGSNIEVAPDISLEPRAPTEFVLFGLPFGRLQTLQMFDSAVRRWHASDRLAKLHIIGPDSDKFTRQADALIEAWPSSIAIERHGILPAHEVSRLLRRARFALTNINLATWSKSTAFMACAAHECAVLISERSADAAPLSFAVRAEELDTIAPGEVDARAAALGHWYREHADWPVIAARMAALWREKEAARVG